MDFLNILLYFLLPLVTSVYLFVKKKYSYFEEQKVPHIKPSSWIMGNMSGIGSKIHLIDFMRQLYRESKRKDIIAGYFISFCPSYFVTNLELVKQITVKDFNTFTDRGFYENEKDEPLTGHLLGLKGEKWRFIRTKLSPAFTSGKIKMMYDTIASKGDSFIQAVIEASKSGSVNIKDISNRFTIDVISSTAFGMEADTLLGKNNEMVRIFKTVFSEGGVSLLYFVFIQSFSNLAKFLHLKHFNKTITNFFYGVVGDSIRHREDMKVDRNDFLNMLIQLKNKGSIDGEFSSETRKLTMDECVAQAFIFFFAGADTSSTTISFVLSELGKNPEIQEKLRREINEHVKEEITYENLHEMTYLAQVVNETLRMYPSAYFVFRRAENDYQIPNSRHVIKKGVQLMIPIICFHYDEEFWEAPEMFNPDRFSPENNSVRPNLAFMPFGEGPRNCIGMRFAQVAVKFAVATIIKNFKVSLDKTKTKYPFQFQPKSALLEPLGGSWIQFEKIKA